MNPSRNRRTSSPLALDHGMSRQVRGGLTVAALVLVPLLAVATGDAFRAALDFTTGVLSLVSLTSAVAWGLIATDRLLLSSRHRLLAQGIHRATAVASLGFLLLHVSVKVSLGHVSLIGALVPFGLGISGTNGLIGFGSLAGLLMIVAATTGAMRSAFAVPGRIAGRWRATHMVAYPAWCFALMHGLYTGRPAATWVTTMYCLALAGVAAAVALRLLPAALQRRIANKLVALSGGARQRAEPEQSRRDLASDPLPGTTGLSPQPMYEQLTREPTLSAQPLGTPLGRSRPPPRLAAPAPPLYEAEPASVDPYPVAGSFSSAGAATTAGQGTVLGGGADPYTAPPLTDPFSGRAPDPGPGPGTGLSAGYRAVSLGADPTARGPLTPPSGDIPLAERIPMTEELPIITEETLGRGGSWPAPSPPPPGQAFAPPAPAPSQAPTRFQAPAPSPYDTGAVPAYGPNGASPYDTGALPSYDTGGLPVYDTGSLPPYNGHGPASPVGPAYDDGSGTEPSPGPLYQPPAGEPWNAPAGERP